VLREGTELVRFVIGGSVTLSRALWLRWKLGLLTGGRAASASAVGRGGGR
jgi:hypothetical protein